MDLRKSLEEPVSKFMSTSFVRIQSDRSVTDAAKAMKASEQTEAVVTKGEEPMGIITERDIVYKVVAQGRDPSSTKVQEVMASPIQTIDDASTAEDAIAKMSKLGVRRLGVTKGGKIIGMLTQKSVVSNRLGEQIVLPELAAPNKITCPYCGSAMKDSKELSKHIDNLHIGRGVLEGVRET